MALGIGGAAAAGLESGFNMGLRFDEAQERKRATGAAEERAVKLDTERATERERNNQIQDEDRQFSALTQKRDDQRYRLGAVHAKYKGAPGGIPTAEVDPLLTEIAGVHSEWLKLVDQRAKPLVEQRQQQARDLNARMAIGQADIQALPSTEYNDHLLASTGFTAKQLLGPEVKQALIDAQAGLQAQNFEQVYKAANVLLPEIRQGIGEPAKDGSIIINKELVGFAPAPIGPLTEAGAGPAVTAVNPVQGLTAALTAATAPDSPAPAAAGGEPGMLQPGTDPDKLLPIIKVTTRQPDGTITSYPAPITKGRNAASDAEIAGPVSMKDLMDRLGQVGVLAEWVQKPEVRAKLEEGVKATNGKPTTFEQAWGMVHGNLDALTDDNDPTSKKFKAYEKYAKEHGISVAEVARIFDGKEPKPLTGVAGTLAAIKTSNLSPADQTKAERVALKVDAAPKAPGKATGGTGLGSAPADSGSTAVGDELFKMLKPQDQATVEGLIDGTIKPETLSVRNNHREMLVSVARRVAEGRQNGSTMNTSTAGVNTATEKAFTSGRPSLTVRAMNTAVDHLDTLGKLAKALNNNDVQAVNALKNKAAEQFGDVDVTNFDAAKQIVADEVIKAVVASGGSVGGALADREKAEAQIKNAKTPAQLQGVIDTFTKLMVGQINSLGQQYVSGGGTKDFTTFLTPATRALYKGPQPPKRGTGLSDNAKPAAAGYASEADAAAAAKAGKLKPGDRITINGQTGTWQ